MNDLSFVSDKDLSNLSFFYWEKLYNSFNGIVSLERGKFSLTYHELAFPSFLGFSPK